MTKLDVPCLTEVTVEDGAYAFIGVSDEDLGGHLKDTLDKLRDGATTEQFSGIDFTMALVNAEVEDNIKVASLLYCNEFLGVLRAHATAAEVKEKEELHSD